MYDLIRTGVTPYSSVENAQKYLRGAAGGVLSLLLKDEKPLPEAALKSLKVISQNDR